MRRVASALNLSSIDLSNTILIALKLQTNQPLAG
jgi:hypothetical protein